eukprot:TRINITY_DN16963_c0_g1_i2.p1 TRINITY_DN16963_c0_g1~~TRINITY_DN16963_c0_g1_i2.p1  ORF type:complete len:297 (-),score=48.98 TRINITY_DN16963_c0_g1_i2:336-1226(-)
MADSVISTEHDEDLASQKSPRKTVAGEDEPKLCKRSGGAPDKERLAKRPRWGDKAFDDITIGDVEHLVRKCNSLEKKVEANSELMNQVKELQDEKKDLERQLVDSAVVVSRVKSSMVKQFQAQMIYNPEFSAELKVSGPGRTISAFVPNVSVELVKAIGGAVNVPQKKRVKFFFEKAPSKSVGAKADKVGGTTLVVEGNITLKYIKTTCELQASATYKFGVLDKDKKPKAKGSGKGKRGAAAPGLEAQTPRMRKVPRCPRMQRRMERKKKGSKLNLVWMVMATALLQIQSLMRALT